MCIVQRSVRHARIANEIREYLVIIIRKYLGHPLLVDDGNIESLRKILMK
jgi:hypothetical protein